MPRSFKYILLILVASLVITPVSAIEWNSSSTRWGLAGLAVAAIGAIGVITYRKYFAKPASKEFEINDDTKVSTDSKKEAAEVTNSANPDISNIPAVVESNSSDHVVKRQENPIENFEQTAQDQKLAIVAACLIMKSYYFANQLIKQYAISDNNDKIDSKKEITKIKNPAIAEISVGKNKKSNEPLSETQKKISDENFERISPNDDEIKPDEPVAEVNLAQNGTDTSVNIQPGTRQSPKRPIGNYIKNRKQELDNAWHNLNRIPTSSIKTRTNSLDPNRLSPYLGKDSKK